MKWNIDTSYIFDKSICNNSSDKATSSKSLSKSDQSPYRSLRLWNRWTESEPRIVASTSRIIQMSENPENHGCNMNLNDHVVHSQSMQNRPPQHSTKWKEYQCLVTIRVTLICDDRVWQIRNVSGEAQDVHTRITKKVDPRVKNYCGVVFNVPVQDLYSTRYDQTAITNTVYTVKWMSRLPSSQNHLWFELLHWYHCSRHYKIFQRGNLAVWFWV